MKQLYIDRGITQNRVMLLCDGSINDIYIDEYNSKSITGNIYMGRVENVVPGLNAAFINIGVHQNAILHFDELRFEALKRGQDVLVQVVREPNEEKGAVVSRDVSIPGKYMVLLPFEKCLNISKKINYEGKREKLRDMFCNISKEDFGIIIRTEAQNADEADILNEYINLRAIVKKIMQSKDYLKSPTLLFDSKDFYNYILREFVKSDLDEIIVNSLSDYEDMKEMFKSKNSDMYNKIFYKEYDFRYMNIFSNSVKDILKNKIELESGGYLLINETPAFTIIDVNTGSCTSEENFENTALKINTEACSAIYNTLRIRNISGIVLIDFIKHKDVKNRSLIEKELENKFSHDKVYTKIYGFTRLGIMEMTRAKKGKKLLDFIYNDENYNPSYLLKEIENKCIKTSKYYSKNDFNVYVSRDLWQEIQNKYMFFNKSIYDIYKLKVNIIPSDCVENFIIDGVNKSNLIDVKLSSRRDINGDIYELE